ncbi:MAG: hypothetical protein KDK91_08025 [Gammaproteobacteria bacterium]|nr:hypothetical protein [Gammaproteobacteria bacterium]
MAISIVNARGLFCAAVVGSSVISGLGTVDARRSFSGRPRPMSRVDDLLPSIKRQIRT